MPGDAPPRPIGTYALTKTLGEQVAAYYGREFGTEAVILRIAAPLEVEGIDLSGVAVRPQQVPFPDLARAFALALTAEVGPGAHIATIVGESSRRNLGPGAARRLLGYEPTIRLDDLGVTFAEAFEVEPR